METLEDYIEELKEISKELEFQVMVAKSCNVPSVTIKSEHCSTLLSLCNGFISRYEKLKGEGI